MESQFLSVIKVWAAMAWADGVIAPQEAAAMKRFIQGAKELSAAERGTALGWLDKKVELELGGVKGLGKEAREGIYRAALRLAGVDANLADEEMTMLQRLREGLGIDEDTARRIVETSPGPG